MSLMAAVLGISSTNRVTLLNDNLAAGAAWQTMTGGNLPGGTVTATWERLGTRGEGVVNYASKEYSTVPKGFTSIPKGTEVQMSYSQGTYYTNW